MNCGKIRKLLESYYDETLDTSLSQVVEEHLGSCESCMKEYESYSKIGDLLRMSNEVELPSDEYFEKLRLEVIPNIKHRSIMDYIKRMITASGEIFFSPRPVLAFARFSFILIIGLSAGYLMRDFNKVEFIKEPDNKSLASLNTELINKEKSEIVVFKTDPKPISLENIYNPIGSLLSSKSDIEKSIAQSAAEADTAPIDKKDRMVLVANKLMQSNVLDEIQDIKLNLYNSGGEKYIPQMHELEGILYDIVSTGEKSNQLYIENMKLYQKAETYLLKKNYLKAEESYYKVIKHDPTSLFAYLSRYQIGNIDFDVLHNYSGALINYQKCLEDYPSHYINEDNKAVIHTRLNLLTENSQNNWDPLKLYMTAKKDKEAINSYYDLILKYPQSPLVFETANSLKDYAISRDSDEQTASDILKNFQRFQDENPDNKYNSLFQFAIADILNFRFNDYKQSLLEYSKILKEDVSPELQDTILKRVQELYSKTM